MRISVWVIVRVYSVVLRRTAVGVDWRFDNLSGSHHQSMMMASSQVVETSVNTNNSPSQDYTTNPDDHSNHNIDSPGFKPFTVKCVFIDHMVWLTIMYRTGVKLPRVSIRRTPLYDAGQLRLVPKVSVLERYDCNTVPALYKNTLL